MRKLPFFFILALLLGITSGIKAQCYGNVHLDQTVTGYNVSSFDISTTFSNEIILISTDGWPGPFTGNVTVDGNGATLLNSAINGNSGETAVWVYEATAAGAHAIVVTETGYSSSFDFDMNFASSYYSTNSCTPLSLANVTSVATSVACNTYGSITDNITTARPNSILYSSVECNDVNATSYEFSYTGATFIADTHAGSGIEASDAYTSATTAGTYSITGTTASPNSGCEGGLTMVLVAIQPNVCGVSVTVTPTNPTCSNNNGSITATVSGGTSPYTYAWTPSGGTNVTASGLSAGTYTVTVTDHAGCTGTASITLMVTNTLSASGNVTTNVNCNGNSTGSATITPTGGASPYTYIWNPGGQTTATVSTLSAGTYTVTVTDHSGCSATTTVTISQPSQLTATMGSPFNIGCNGGNNGSASVTAAGGTSPYTYLWAPSGGSGANAGGLSAGTYTVTVTDNNGCAATGSVTITQPATTVIATMEAPLNELCFGDSSGSATVTASGGTPGYSYIWAPRGGTDATASDLIAGTYTVTVTDADFCTATASVTITQPASAVAITIASQTNVNCNTLGSATANAATGGTSPYTYSWSPSGGTNLIASNLSAGSYTITAKDANGCSATASVTITQAATSLAITIASQTNAVCSTLGSATANAATGGTSPYTYAWSPSGGTNLTASNLSAGSYTITAMDANGCSATASVTITQTASSLAITIASQTNVLCNTLGSATANAATGGTSPYTYLWSSGGGTNLTASNLSAGTYTITAKDANGCSATASVTITQSATTLAITIASHTNVLCNTLGNATANAATGGTSPYTYAWSPSGGTNLTASNLSAGSYTVTAMDANGCSATASVIITGTASNMAITIASQTNVLCNTLGSATANPATGGASPYTYAWSPSGGTNLTASNLSAGSYTITAMDANGCSATASVTISQAATTLAITIASHTNIFCNSEGSATANAATGGTSPYVYNWSPSGGTNLTASNLSVGTYTITAHDNNGCSATASVTITGGASTLTISIASKTTLVCEGMGYITAHTATGGTPPYVYNWTPSGGTNLSTITTLSAGTYTITATDSNGCTATASESISYPAHLGITVTATNSVTCYGGNNGSATATASGGTPAYTYSWFPSGGTHASESGLTAGTYTVTVTDSNGCTADYAVTIVQPAPMVIQTDSIDNSGTNGGNGCNGEAWIKVVSGGTPPYTYLWAGGQTTDTITGQCDGLYCVTVTSANGCSQSTCVIIITATGVDNINGNGESISVYPNPSTGQFTITGLESGMVLEMYDYTGRKISSQFTVDNSQLTFNISNQPDGMYLIRILTKDGILVSQKKIVKMQ
jgi:large repetitive protein